MSYVSIKTKEGIDNWCTPGDYCVRGVLAYRGLQECAASMDSFFMRNFSTKISLKIGPFLQKCHKKLKIALYYLCKKSMWNIWLKPCFLDRFYHDRIHIAQSVREAFSCEYGTFQCYSMEYDLIHEYHERLLYLSLCWRNHIYISAGHLILEIDTWIESSRVKD